MQELIERCAACEAKPTIVQDLIGSMGKLTEAHRDVEYMMKEIMALIEVCIHNFLIIFYLMNS